MVTPLPGPRVYPHHDQRPFSVRIFRGTMLDWRRLLSASRALFLKPKYRSTHASIRECNHE